VTIDSSSLLTFVSAVLVGAVVPLITFLYLRRGQLRQLNTTSDATQITSAATLVALLQDQIKILTAKQDKIEGQQSTDRTNFTEQLSRAHTENGRMASIIATLHTDLDIAHRQIEELRASYRMRMNSAESEDTGSAMDEGAQEIQDSADDFPPQ